MELDTGAAVSIISEDTKKSLFPDVPLQHSRITLRTYTGERIEVAGEIQVNVQYGQQAVERLPLVVVKGGGPPLFGRNWLGRIQLDWASIKMIRKQPATTLDELRKWYS